MAETTNSVYDYLRIFNPLRDHTSEQVKICVLSSVHKLKHCFKTCIRIDNNSFHMHLPGQACVVVYRSEQSSNCTEE